MKKRISIVIFGFIVVNFMTSVGAYCIRPYSQTPPSNSFTVSALPAYNWLKYSKNNTLSSGDFDVGFGLTFRPKPLTGNLQLAIGVNYRKYYGTMDFNGLVDSVHMTTEDIATGVHHRYFLYQAFNSTEQQTVTYIEPNIRLEYSAPLASRVDFMGGLGVAYGMHFAESNEMTSGSYRRYAWFYENNNLIENNPAGNLSTYTNFLNPSAGETFKHSLFALGEIGFRFHLSSRWQLLTLFNVQYSLLNIQAKQDAFTQHDSYSGIAASEIPQGIRAISAGVEIGLTHRFEKSQRSTKKRRYPTMHGAHCPY
ncbi:MAG: hypothetical protein FWG79_05485 [Bacteroidales bacterium]|nr:hypothetical protein [Bacteroidales bacterium]